MPKDFRRRQRPNCQQLCWHMAGPGGDSSTSTLISSTTKLKYPFAQCESVAHHTHVPVLRHRAFKPAYSCITAIRGYFSSLRIPIQDEELIVVGDRVFTDIVMANRMRGNNRSSGLSRTALVSNHDDIGNSENKKVTTKIQSRGPLAIWTTDVWENEAMMMRWCEKRLVDVVRRWTQTNSEDLDTARFIKTVIPPKPPRTEGMITALLGRLRQG